MRFGFAMFLQELIKPSEFKEIEDAFSFLLQGEYIEVDESEVFSLTKKGKTEAQKSAKGMYSFIKMLNRLSKPEISPILSLIIHIILGVAKLIGFILTGSIGLLGDGLDSVMDGISSIIVSVAMRIRKEKSATYFLLILMLITGFGIIIQGINRFIQGLSQPIPLEESTIGLIIAGVSIILCGGLYIYQRYSGYTNRNLTILTQSEDSKNHVLNAFLVFLAIFASSVADTTNLNILYLLDSIVGCFIGLIILQGAYEIFQDLRAEARGEEIDYDKYKLGVWKRLSKMQSKVVDTWILYKIDTGIKTFSSLIESFESEFVPLVVKVSDDKQHILDLSQNKNVLDQRFEELINRGLLKEEKKRLDTQSQLTRVVSLTKEGRKRLEEEIKRVEIQESRRKRRHNRWFD